MPHQRIRISYSAPAMTVPAVRMVLLLVSAKRGDPTTTEVEVHPVLALRSVVREDSRFSTDDRVLLTNFESNLKTEAIVCIDHQEVESVEDALSNLECVAYRVIAAPWDSIEDADRFEPHLEELREEAAENALAANRRGEARRIAKNKPNCKEGTR